MTRAPTADAAATGPARTIFFGSGAFAVPMLDALLALPEVHVVAAVSVADQPAGRGRLLNAAPLARHAAARNVPLLQPTSLRDPATLAAIADLRPDLGVLADYGRIVPAAILELPARGILNVHPSILPRHRGAAPIPATILAGDPEAGVTIIRMDAGVDTGPIVASVAWPLAGTEGARELEATAAGAGAALLARTVPAWVAGVLEEHHQEAEAATLTRPLRREDGRLDGSEPAIVAERRVRAFDPWPGTFIEVTGMARDATTQGAEGSTAQRAAVLRAAVLRAASAGSMAGDVPGTLVADDRGLALATIDGRLRLLDVRPAGGRPMTGDAWRRGRPGLVGSRTVTT